MRVIAGIAKKRRLKAPKGLTVRPTADRVKEALFNILKDKIEDCSFLDLFAGTGNIGIEALSRGAARVTFIDYSPRSIRFVKENLILCRFEDKAEVIQVDAFEYVKKQIKPHERYDIVFIDPPYRADLLEILLPLLGRSSLLKDEGVMVIEHSQKIKLPAVIGRLTLFKSYRYGDTTLSLYYRLAENLSLAEPN